MRKSPGPWDEFPDGAKRLLTELLRGVPFQDARRLARVTNKEIEYFDKHVEGFHKEILKARTM